MPRRTRAELEVENEELYSKLEAIRDNLDELLGNDAEDEEEEEEEEDA